MERKIITAMINDSAFLKDIEGHYQPQYLGSTNAKRIAGWCIDHYQKYGEAPGFDAVSTIYIEEVRKNGIPKDQRQDLKDILDELEGEESAGATEFMLDTYFKHCDLVRREDLANQLLDATGAGDTERAAEISRKLGELGRVNETAVQSLEAKIEACLYTSTEFRQLNIPKPKVLLDPWLVKPSLNMIYGPRGIGKTFLSTIISVLLTRKKGAMDLPKVGDWSVTAPTGVLYVDAEMASADLQYNVDQFCINLPQEHPDHPFVILSVNQFMEQTGEGFRLSTEGREAITSVLKKRPDLEVVIFDNKSILFPKQDENSSADWDEANNWLISLKHLGRAVILLHHAGKNGTQRGTSSSEDAMHFIIKLSKPEAYKEDRDFAWFRIDYDKHRSLKPGDSKRGFNIRVVPHESGRGLSWVEDETGQMKDELKELIMEILTDKLSISEIAQKTGRNRQYVNRIRKEEVLGRGLMVKKGPREYVLTDAGIDFMETG